MSAGRPAADGREYERRVEDGGGDAVLVPPDTAGGGRSDETSTVAAVPRFPIQ